MKHTMERITKYLPVLAGTIGASVSRLLGGWDTALTVMFLLMGLDYLTGLALALLGRSGKTKDGRFRSSAAFKGLTRKLMMVVIVMLGTALDRMLNTDSVCRIAVIGFYAANEGLSILENALALGVPVPDSLRRLLDTLREKGNEKELPETREK